MTAAKDKSTAGVAKTASADGSPIEIVRRFLGHLAAGDVDSAVDMLGAEVEYVNVSTPAIRGRERVRRVLGAAMRMRGAGFEVYLHSVSADDSTVLTERTDVLIWGRLRVQIWVCGRFDVRAGEIVLWRDYFDWVNVTLAMLRALVGIVVPALEPRPPTAAP
jgi:limonene-1,2-epoxide hydrolase